MVATCLLGVAVISAGQPTSAQTTWNNNVGNDEWQTAGNWSAGLPTSGVGAVIVNGDTVLLNSGMGNASSINISGGSQLTVESGANLNSSFLNLATSATQQGGLNVQTGGSVISTLTSLGAATGSTGTATVNGAGSQWSNSSTLNVGSAGTGVLNVQAGGLVSNSSAIMGFASGSTGTATVTGANSRWNSSSTLSVGSGGAGVVNIDDMGEVSSSSTTLGVGSGSTGALNLNGGAHITGQVQEGAGTGTVDFDGGTLRLSGNQANLFAGFETGDVTLNAGGGTIDTNGSNVTTSTVLDGTGGLTKTGTGRLTLTGNNTYTGGTTINAGTLAVSSDANLGDASGGVTIGSAVLRSNASFATSRTVTLTNNGRITTGGTSTLTLNGNIGESGGSHRLFKLGGGTLVLNGTNTYSDGTTISDGTLLATNTTGSATGTGAVTVQNGGAVGGNGFIGGEVTVLDGGTLAPGTSPGTLTINNNLVLNNASNLNYELDTPGTVGMGVNDLVQVNGNLTLDGILNIANLGSFGDGTYRLMNYTGGLTDNGLLFGIVPGAFDLDVDTTIANQINLTVAAATEQFWDGANTSPNGTVDGGTGTWDGSTTNWTNSNGNLNSPWNGGLDAVFAGTAGTVTIADGFAADPSGLDFQVDGYILDSAGTGSLNLTGNTPVNVATGTATIDAPITGTGILIKNGDGTLLVTDVFPIPPTVTNTYSGGTILNAGTLRALSKFNGSTPLGTGNLTINGGTLGNINGFFLDLDNNVIVNGDFGVDTLGNSVTLAGDVDLGADTRTITVTRNNSNPFLGGSLFLSGEVSGAGGVTFTTSGPNGAEVWYQGSQDNTYTGLTTVQNGVDLRLDKFDFFTPVVTAIAGDLLIESGGEVSLISNNQIADTATVTVNGTLEAELSEEETIGNLQGSGFIEGGGNPFFGTPFVLTVNQGSFSGIISDGLGELELIKDTADTLILSGDNTYTGGTTISDGTLQIGDGGTTGTFGTGNVVNNGTLAFNRSNTLTVNQTISGTGNVQQIGTGTTVLAGNNTYSGGTNADAGLLQFTGTTNTGTGSLFTTNGDVLVNDGGDLTTTSGFIADAAGTTSTVTVDGGDTVWTTTGQLFVGDDGNGTLNVTDEAEVTTQGNGFIGRAAGSVGMVTVDNAQYDTNGQLFIGGDVGTGTVHLLNGSSMTNNQTRLATNAGSMGTLLVDDSTLDAGTLTVSQSGEALMTVQNGSMLTTSTSADFVGQVGMGTLIVDDSMANFGGDLFVGNNTGSNGILTVRNGATANITGQTFIGTGFGATGTVTIDNATWMSTDRIFVGNQGNGTLNIINGSTVTSGGLNPFIGASADATGTLLVDGAGTNYTVSNTGDFAMRGQNSSITVSGGAELSTQGRVFLLADNGTTNNVLITGNGSKWTTGNEVSLGHTGTDVVMTLADGGTLSIGGSEALFVNDGPTNGTLNIGNGGGAGILDAANVTGGFTGGGVAELNLNHTEADYFFTRDGTAGGANVGIGGNLAVNHMGTGTTTFNGANSYTGGTNITGGTLVAANMNALGSGNVNVNTAGTLRAMGPVNVGGNFNLTAGGILVIDVNSPDQLNVTGDADIQDGSLVATGTLARGEEKLVLEADGTLSGELAAALLPVGAIVEQNDQQLFLIGGSDASAIIAAATTPNEKAVANMLAPLFITPGLSPDLDEVLSTFEVLAANGQDDQVRLGLNQLSPAGLGTIKRMAFAYSNAQYRNLQRRGAELRAGFRGASTQGLTFFDRNGRMRPGAFPALAGATMDAEAISILGIDAKTFEAQPDNRWGFFANGSGQFGDVDGGDNLPGYDFDSAGMTMGIDYRVARNFVLGFATGYAGSEADVDSLGSEVDVDSARFGLYASWFDRDFEFTGEGWYVDAYAGGAYNSYTTDRAITFGGLNRTATGETEGLQVDASLIGGYDFQLGSGFVLFPYTGVQYTRVDIDGYTETGAQSLNLTVNDTDADSLRSNLGIVLGWSGEAAGITWRPEVRAAWQHEFLDGIQTVNSRFASGAAAAFVTRLGNEAPRDTALIGASLNANITETTSAFLSYDAEVNADYLTHSINGGFSIRF